MKDVISVKIGTEHGNGNLFLFFGNGARITICNPFGQELSRWPNLSRQYSIEYQQLKNQSLSLALGITVGTAIVGWDAKPEDCLSPLNDGSDMWVYHPKETDLLGK
ncbi:hypothetical protein [Leptospira alexanderi]|uniref:hypothetical protein n=1 Tax=Leptospira alexanderi TaxID=100053 RepID=UPI000990AD00|nr:hypothetical protein [Leptospira alexanderi]